MGLFASRRRRIGVVLAVLVPLALFGIVAERNSWRPQVVRITDKNWFQNRYHTFSADGARLYTLNNWQVVRRWDSSTGGYIDQIPSENRNGGAVKFALSADGQSLALALDKRGIVIYDLATGRERQRVGPGIRFGEYVRFSPNGKLLVADGNYSILVWDLATRRRVFMSEAGDYDAAAFSGDGRLLAVANNNDPNFICLYDTTTWRVVQKWRRAEIIERLQFDPSGRNLLVKFDASHDLPPQLFDVATGKLLATLRGPLPRLYMIQAIAFSPDGSLVAVAESDCSGGQGTFQLDGAAHLDIFDARNGALVRSLPRGNINDEIMALGFRDASHVVMVSQSGIITTQRVR